MTDAGQKDNRVLLPTLRRGTVIRTPPKGVWTPFAEARRLAEQLEIPTDSPRAWSEITSIPSPWARMLLFKHALEQGDTHPLFEEVLSDVMDTLEILFRETHLGGQVRLVPIDLAVTADLDEGSEYIASLLSFAPRLPSSSKALTNSLTEVSAVLYGRDEAEVDLVAISSPFTLFFTPVDKPRHVDGFYEFPIQPGSSYRPLAERDPLFVSYLREHVLRQLKHKVRKQPMRGLLDALDNELKPLRPPPPAQPPVPRQTIRGLLGMVLSQAGDLEVSSPWTLKPAREVKDRLPLVLTQDRPNGEYYNNQLAPQPWLVDPSDSRSQLPGTRLLHPWLFPYDDFLEESLIQLSEPIAGVHRDKSRAANTAAFLLPLKEEYFRFFRPKDVTSHLTIDQNPHGVVTVHLTIPVEGGADHPGAVVVRRTYQPGDNVQTLPTTYLSMWPQFRSSHWNDYFLLHYDSETNPSNLLTVRMWDEEGRPHPTLPHAGPPEPTHQTSVQRDGNTVVHHTGSEPSIVQLKLASSSVSGVLLPNLINVDKRANPRGRWKVGIDFGTSNTIVSVADTEHPEVPKILRFAKATRLDLLSSDSALCALGRETLRYYFFPLELTGEPFSSHVFWLNEGSGEDERPVLNANIPFTGDVSSAAQNLVRGELKWSAAAEGNRLSRLFLEQVVLMIRAEALAHGILPENVDWSWSYPMAFSPNRRTQFNTIWAGLLGPDASSSDESTCGLLFFEAVAGGFDAAARAAKITIDIGGGTSDIAAYSEGKTLFRDSVLFGGRDLTGSALDEEAYRDSRNPFVNKLFRFALAHGLSPRVADVLERYPSSHSRFSYLVRSAWFEKRAGDIATQDWFESFQIACLYFVSSLFYYVGLHLRPHSLDDDALPNKVFIGGNGARYLDWLTSLSPWRSTKNTHVVSGLTAIMAAGMDGRSLDLQMRMSPHPKHEVALGLLRPQRDLQGDPGPSAICGESVAVHGKEAKEPTFETRSLEITGETVSTLRFLQPLRLREISRLNEAFLEILAPIGYSHENIQQTQEVVYGLSDTFYQDAVVKSLNHHLRGEPIYNGSLFVLESAACLRELL